MRRLQYSIRILVQRYLFKVMDGRKRKRKASASDVMAMHVGKSSPKKKKKLEKLQQADKGLAEETGIQPSGVNVVSLDAKSLLFLKGDLQNCCLLFFKVNQEVALQGKADIKSLLGTVSILGSLISPCNSFYQVFSPSSSSFLTIRDTASIVENRQAHLISIKELLHTQSKDIRKAGLLRAQKASSVLMLKSLRTVDTDFLCQYKPYEDLFSTASIKDTQVDNSSAHDDTSAALGFRLRNVNSEDLTVFHEPKQWSDLLHAIHQIKEGPTGRCPSLLICGGKGVGKSTFARFMVNGLLNSFPEVCYLECDVGQTEFTPPAILSITRVTSPLLGSPFTHQQWPERAYFFGDISPRDNPQGYIKSIEDLHSFYKKRLDGIPLVVNTQGWVKGMGIPLLMDVFRITQPSHLIQINSTTQASKNLPMLTRDFLMSTPGWVYPVLGRGWVYPVLGQSGIDGSGGVKCEAFDSLLDNLRNGDTSGSPTELLTDMHHTHNEPVIVQLKSACTQGDQASRLHSSDHRAMKLISYFSKVQDVLPVARRNNGGPSSLTCGPSSLTSYVPYKVPWNHMTVAVVHTEVPRSHVLMSLNASIVGLAVSSSTKASGDLEQSEVKVLHKAPHSLECLGLGIVRNVDPVNKLFYILTPVPLDVLKRVNILLKGNLEVPASLWLQEARACSPYISSEFTYDLKGAGARKVRYNLLRKRHSSPGRPVM